MSGHTPGPWALLAPNDLWLGRPIFNWAITTGNHDVWICTGPTWDDEFKAENDANARLIAAAPELLDVAQRSAAALVSAGVESNANSDNPLEGLLHMTLAAIAKATGCAA